MYSMLRVNCGSVFRAFHLVLHIPLRNLIMMNCYTFKRFTKSFPNVSLSVIPEFYDRYVFVECAGEQYGSQFSRLNGSSYILAKWADRYDGNINLNASDARPGIVLYLIKQTVTVGERVCTFCLAHVNWFQYHPRRFHCGPSGAFPEVWCANVFDSFGASSFVPVQRIWGKFLAGYDKRMIFPLKISD